MALPQLLTYRKDSADNTIVAVKDANRGEVGTLLSNEW